MGENSNTTDTEVLPDVFHVVKKKVSENIAVKNFLVDEIDANTFEENPHRKTSNKNIK